jgi:hypothetical protein
MDGTFTLRTLVMGAPTIGAYVMDPSDEGVQRWRYGQRSLEGCPETPVTVTADDGYDLLTASGIGLTVTGATIAWNASYRAQSLTVTSDTAPFVKWLLEESVAEAGFAGPVTFGTVPQGATQTSPTSGPPLASGDTIYVSFSGRSASGYPYFGYVQCSYGTGGCGAE